MFELIEQCQLSARIKVIGIGGGGSNAVNTMIGARLSGVDFMVANTDAQSLQASYAPVKIQLGGLVTKGLGAGANPEVGRRAALENQDQIKEYLEGSDMIFITAGMNDRDTVFNGYDSGAVDFLHKPIDPRILKNKVETFYQLCKQRLELADQAGAPVHHRAEDVEDQGLEARGCRHRYHLPLSRRQTLSCRAAPRSRKQAAGETGQPCWN